MYIPFDISAPPSIPLHTKNLSCQYQAGRLRYIKAGNTEVARMVYGALRDADWGTVACDISNEQVRQDKNHFTITYTARYRQHDILYEAAYRIEGRSDDTIVFEMKGKALSGFESNRIGLCVHLPVKECAGAPVNITDVYGATRSAHFPGNISPHQPFSQLRQLRWKVEDHTEIELSLEGDVFEAEDQRNWMDHSFKIYSRPLELSFPFSVRPGDAMQQKVVVRVEILNNERLHNDHAATIETGPMPAIGFAAADEPALLTSREIALLLRIPFAHYRAELDLETGWKNTLAIHSANAKALGTALELVLFFTDNYVEEVSDFITTIAGEASIISSILPLHKAYKTTPLFLQEHFYPVLKKSFPAIMAGYGTDAYFTELNRQRPEHGGYDFVSFSLNPQVHGFDEKTLLENIETIPDMIRTIRSFTDKPVYFSPVTFRKRKNHDGAAGTRHNLVNNFDERQHTWFGAGWFLLCLFQLRDMHQVTFFKTTGDSGMIGTANESTPLYQVLARIQLFGATTMIKKTEGGVTQIIFRNRAGDELVFQPGAGAGSAR